MSDAPSGENFYLRHDRYWVAPDEQADYPVRQGDLFADIEVAGERWPAALLIHPTCELAKVSVGRVQVARVQLLDELGEVGQRARVVAGLSVETNGVRIQFAHTFFIAPAEHGGLAEPMFANLREIALIDRALFSQDRRAAAMTHNARVTLIRRYLYFRFRMLTSFQEVRALEAARIRADPAFAGPRPDWAGAADS